MGPLEVSVVTIQPEPLVLTTELPGRTAAFLTAEIRPQVNGIIKSRLFQEGSLVRAGQVLYTIDPSPYKASFNQAQANLATAQAELANAQANLPSLQARVDRYAGLLKVHAVGQQDYDDAKAALLQAQASVNSRKAAIQASRAAVDSARINLAYTPIKAPISGRIGKSNVTVGALATAYQQTPLAMVQQLNNVYVDVVQANADVLRLRADLASGRLQKGSAAGLRKVKLVLEDGSSYPVEGTLQFRDFTVDPTTGAVTLRMVFPNPREILLPGMFVRAVVEEGVRNQAILVPQQAVTRDVKGQPFAWVVGPDNKVQRRALEIERAIGNRWLVTNGLSASDRVVMEGTDRVKAGVPVRAVPFKGDLGPAVGGGQTGKAGGHV